jgi:hypothetical protein
LFQFDSIRRNRFNFINMLLRPSAIVTSFEAVVIGVGATVVRPTG